MWQTDRLSVQIFNCFMLGAS